MPETPDDPQPESDSTDTEDVPADVVDEAERLTRLAREAVDEAEAELYREERASLVSEYDFSVRVRDDDERDVLVMYPDEWVDDGVVQMDRVEDVDRGVERPLGGPGDADDWAAVDAHNSEIVDRVRDEYGPVHGENAAAFATFMSNHYARRLETASERERSTFFEEYYPRNAWPSDEQRTVVEESVAITIEVGESLSGSRR